MRRQSLWLLMLCLPANAIAPAVTVQESEMAVVTRGLKLQFPRDHGAHEQFRTEWWYVTGWLNSAKGPLGFQITFFRSRTPSKLLAGNPSAFTPSQLLIGHAALSDPSLQRLRREQRVARAGLGLAGAATADTHVWIDRWQLLRTAGAYRARMQGEDFSFDLEMLTRQPPMLNGEQGFSQKSPQPKSSSYYYSVPHLAVSGTVTLAGRSLPVTGEAWLDHEWSSEYLDPSAVGWDWLGVNLDDGSALMAFRIRGKDGQPRWAGATLRDAQGRMRIAAPSQVQFTALREWRSPRTSIVYPVQWRITVGEDQWTLSPLMDDQENDTRASTGAIYWEGAVQVLRDEQRIGRGYLELTGYGQPLRLR